ncbi:MAG: tetraacyldisaccharide 4'-kinase [Bacteroidetes bacterium GWE2_29_8]|nr:MAG: tetraacyldisaccharide 4'-kinase [Bacteroidetes bacterium GWE2_29_8]OFY24510.1 MAG: tetraacyldisaccharide 4'-kinase [Bacteroidetes bacterium GWF2_29_10]
MYKKLVSIPLSFVWFIITSIRNYLYDKKILKSISFDIPIICVGNLSVGGSGKTPHVEYIVDMLKSDYKVAVLSRGYRRKTKNFMIVDVDSKATDVGDEPLQIKQKFGNKVIVAVDSDRVNGVSHIISLHKPDVIILDDGFQHRALTPGFNIILTPYYNLFTIDDLLPYGNLRESKSSIKRADIIIVTKTSESLTDDAKKELEYKIGKYKGKNNTVLFSYFEYDELKPLFLMNNYDKEFLKTVKNVVAFCGIAGYNSFYEYLETKFKDTTAITLRDHHNYNERDINRIINVYNNLERTKGSTIIVTTEKDIVKIKNNSLLANQLCGFPIFYLPIKVRLHKNDDMFFKDKILDYVGKNTKIN